MKKLSERTVEALGKVITGATGPVSRSGPQLVSFFNHFGSNDQYAWGGGFPSRWRYAEEKLREFNGSPVMAKIIAEAVDPRAFHGTEISEQKTVEELNVFLEYDGFRLYKQGLHYRIGTISPSTIEIAADASSADPISHEFISDQILKCRSKLDAGDFDGAITNSRSLLEAVLREMESRLSDEDPPTDGDLNKQYKRVCQLLNLDPKKKGLEAPFVEILRGFFSIVNGLASLRNAASDAHARRYRPAAHHARLAINSANTLVDFLFDTYQHQVQHDLLKPKDAPE